MAFWRKIWGNFPLTFEGSEGAKDELPSVVKTDAVGEIHHIVQLALLPGPIEYILQLMILGPVLVALLSIPVGAAFMLLNEGFWKLGLGFLGFSLIAAIVIIQIVRSLVT